MEGVIHGGGGGPWWRKWSMVEVVVGSGGRCP